MSDEISYANSDKETAISKKAIQGHNSIFHLEQHWLLIDLEIYTSFISARASIVVPHQAVVTAAFLLTASQVQDAQCPNPKVPHSQILPRFLEQLAVSLTMTTILSAFVYLALYTFLLYFSKSLRWFSQVVVAAIAFIPFILTEAWLLFLAMALALAMVGGEASRRVGRREVLGTGASAMLVYNCIFYSWNASFVSMIISDLS